MHRIQVTPRIWTLLLVLWLPCNTFADGGLRRARAILKRANLAADSEAAILVQQALTRLKNAPGSEAESLRQICTTYLRAVKSFWQADRHKGSAEAVKLLSAFNGGSKTSKKNPLFLQALLYQARHHYWKAVEGNYPQGHKLSQRMFQEILRHNPRHRLARLYLRLKVEPVKPTLEKPHPGAPEWAVAGREAMYWTRRMVHWWIDHRQAADGQLGGGWSDDVEFSKTWSFFCLCLNDDKVRRSLTKIADNIWHCPSVTNGYFAGTSKNWHLVDVEHGAEWMSFSQPQMMLARYGDPRYIERNMQVIRNMDFLTGVNAAGHRHFKAYYFSHDALHPRQLFRCDVPENGRYAKPGIYVAWYARHPKVLRWFREWGDAWVHHSLDTKLGKPSGFIPSEVVFQTNQVGGFSGKWYRIAGYPGYDFAGGSWTTKHLMGQLIANARLLNNARYVEPIRRIMKWKKDHRNAPYGPEGSTGWILRKEVHAERMWQRWQRLRDGLKPPAVDGLVKELRQIAARHASTWEMNTREVIATDRVAIQAKPSPTLMRMYTGGSGVLQAYYPDSAVAWENIELQVVPMVVAANRQRLKIRLHNFGRSRTIRMRPLELGTGTYRVRLNGKRQADFRFRHRFEPLSLSLPPQSTSFVEVAQIESRPLPSTLPDLALSPTECVLDRSGKQPVLRVRIHNVGGRDSGPTAVAFTAIGPQGAKQIGVHTIRNVRWPRELMPSFVTVTQPWQGDKQVQAIRVSMTVAKPDELCVENNSVLVPINDWLASQDFRERPNLYGKAGTDIPRPHWTVARRQSPPSRKLPDAPGFVEVSRVFGPFRETGNLTFPVRYSPRQSLAWIVRDKKKLYVLVTSWRLAHPLRRQIKKDAPTRKDLARDDRIELLLQLPGKPWWSIQVNANGAVVSARSDGRTWQAQVKSNHLVRSEGWCAEWWCRIELPLSELTTQSISTGDVWRCDIVRHGFAKDGRPQRSSWSGGLPGKPRTWGRITW